MKISENEKRVLIESLQIELNARPDGGNKNLIVPICPYCHKDGGKFGIYIGKETKYKKLFVSHCFKCGKTVKDVNQLLEDIGRSDLKLTNTLDFKPSTLHPMFSINNDDEIDDELCICKMPDCWKRCYKNQYLKSRGFVSDDYDYFPVGTTRSMNFKFDNYVVFPIYDNEDIVGYVGRHIWDKDKIDRYNIQAKRERKYEIRRYNNSVENNFSKLLYNYDAVIDGTTDTVVLLEGVFDVVALTRKLDLYDNEKIVPVATFGKKISDVQIYKLQSKGVRTVVIGYDGDAVSAINNVSATLNEYFDTYIAYIQGNKDFDEMSADEIYDVFSNNIKTPAEYKMQTINISA